MSISRKRFRSDDSCLTLAPQSKYFVNQKLIDIHDDKKMKDIYNKTLNMLFKGAALHGNNKESMKDRLKAINLAGNGSINLECRKEKPSWMSNIADRACKSCANLSVIHGECINCNLEICEFCGHSCMECRAPVCKNCILLFNCGSIEKPCCEQCKQFID